MKTTLNHFKLLFLFQFALVLFVSCSPKVKQDLTTSTVFCDHMVIQRDTPVPIWGKASSGEKITVTFAGQNKNTITDENGNWKLTLAPLEASKKGSNMVISGSKDIVVSDVIIGDVWICSGQSNMQFNVSAVPEIKALVPNMENIRSFEVKRTVSYKEEENVIGKWEETNPTSAVAFSFAYFLEALTDIPVGIIHASWGSSSIEAWMPKDMEENLPYFKTIMDEFNNDTITRNKIEKALNTSEGWSRKEDIFMRRQPNILYNAMIKPLAPFACKGLIWYQGERNTRYISGVPEVTEENWFHKVAGIKEYGGILKLWIERYRKEWKNDDMHFSIVMLPGFGGGTFDNPKIDPQSPTEKSWAWMRESQLKALELHNTSVVNTVDLGDVKNIHPKDKLPIGKRLALLAAKKTLNKDIVAEGPIMKKIEIKENTLIVHYKNSNGLKTINSKSPTGFWIADDSLKWHPAKAKIEGETVILKSLDIKNPKYIRYAFAGKPNVNLINSYGLPAYPFRTDNAKEPIN